VIEPVVVVDAVRHVFPGAHVTLDNLAAMIRQGVVTGLVGSDGAGKTTLMRLIAGLLHSEQGRIVVLGQTWQRMPPQRID
jgi:ABC-2 type transport system ATP-binding protein